MNIKSLSTVVTPLEARLKVENKESVRLKNSEDRDGNGRRESPEPEIKRHLTDEEFDQAVKTLREMPGVVAHGLQVRIEQHEDRRVIFLEDAGGKIIRRLSEAELWAATCDKEKSKGQFFDKTG